MEHASCLGFEVDCGILLKGTGVTIMSIILFIGSVYLLLTAIFGRWMGYLVMMIALSGWMIILSGLWLFGFWSQGTDTPTNLGPRGAEPAWIVLEAATDRTSDRYVTFSEFPGEPWQAASAEDEEHTADIQAAGGAVSTFLAEQMNEELGLGHEDPTAFVPSQFPVESLSFATDEDGKTKLAIGRSHFSGGGPLWTVSLYYDNGSVPRYSYMFLVGSIVLFLIHLPLLDRAERKRKEILTGGEAPAWYGPA